MTLLTGSKKKILSIHLPNLKNFKYTLLTNKIIILKYLNKGFDLVGPTGSYKAIGFEEQSLSLPYCKEAQAIGLIFILREVKNLKREVQYVRWLHGKNLESKSLNEGS